MHDHPSRKPCTILPLLGSDSHAPPSPHQPPKSPRTPKTTNQTTGAHLVESSIATTDILRARERARGSGSLTSDPSLQMLSMVRCDRCPNKRRIG